MKNFIFSKDDVRDSVYLISIYNFRNTSLLYLPISLSAIFRSISFHSPPTRHVQCNLSFYENTCSSQLAHASNLSKEQVETKTIHDFVVLLFAHEIMTFLLVLQQVGGCKLRKEILTELSAINCREDKKLFSERHQIDNFKIEIFSLDQIYMFI